MEKSAPVRSLAWIGIVLTLPAAFCVAATLQSLAWQVQTRLCYTKGSCRVVAAEVVKVGTSFELRIAHQVEIDGRAFGRSENTEQYTPLYQSRKEAEESLAQYAVGSVHPCWYDAKDPARSSVLVDRSMDTGFQFAVFAISLAVGALGIKLISVSKLLSLT